MKALDRKLLRDLRLMWGQALTIALVVASGVAGFITSFSTYDVLSRTRDLYYADARFADVFATLKQAPSALARQLKQIPGAAHVETSLAQVVPIAIPNVPDAIIGRLIGLDVQAPQRLNKLQLRSGRMIKAYQNGAIETLVSEGFAIARQLKPGDQISALVNGKPEVLLIVGIALSPEYIFSGMEGSPDQRSFGVFWIDSKALGGAYNLDGVFNQVAVRLSPGATASAVIDHLNHLLAPFGGIAAHGRDQQMSHMILNSEIKEQRVVGTVLPIIFLAIAGAVLNIVLGRQIATQWAQVGTLKALGYDNKTIGVHYLKLVLVIVTFGVALGLALGALVGDWFIGFYSAVFRFPELHYRIKPALILAVVSGAVVVAVLATLNTLRATVKLAPAKALRPPSPGVYKQMLIDRWGLLQHLSPAARMVIRTMGHRPLRAGLTIFGIAGAMAIVITGVFWRDSIAVLMDTQFNQVLRGDVSIRLVEASPDLFVQKMAQLPHVTAVEGARTVSARLVHANHTWRGAVQGKIERPELHRIVGLKGHVFTPPRDGLLLTDRLADRLHARPGDSIRVEFLEGRLESLELVVIGVVPEMMGMNAYIERHTLNRILREDDVVNQVTLAVEQGREATLLNKLKEVPQIAETVSKSLMQRNIAEVTARNVRVLSGMLTLFATLIAIGVIYNNARVALAERTGELASLRVLGFTRGEVSIFLLRELAVEIILALPLGMVLGYFLASAVVGLIRTDEFYFPFVIQPATYAFAALCMLAAALVGALLVRRRMDSLDLVGLLKTRE